MKTSFCYLARRSRQLPRFGANQYNSFYRAVSISPAFPQSNLIRSMSTPASSVVDKLKELSLDPLPQYPNCYPDLNPVDVYRAHLTSILAEVTGVSADIVYPALQWTQTLEKGDLVLPVPALRIKGKKPAELAEEWVAKVRLFQLAR